MSYEKVLAQGEVDTSKGFIELVRLPKELQGGFQKAKELLGYVGNGRQAIKEKEYTFHK